MAPVSELVSMAMVPKSDKVTPDKVHGFRLTLLFTLKDINLTFSSIYPSGSIELS